jgi:Tfp pilus assembly protein PilO
MSYFTAILVAVVRRHPFAVLCIVLTLGVGAGAWTLHDKVVHLKSVLAERSKQGEVMLAGLVTGRAYRDELDTVRDAARRIEENLLVESNLAENLWYFYKLEENTRARLPELHQLSAPMLKSSPLYKRIPYSLRAVGSFDELSKFLAALETGPRLANITSFTYTRRDVRDQSFVLDLNLDLLAKK